MPYRKRSDAPSGTGELVTFRSYLDPIKAKLDAARLTAEGLETHLFDEGLHNVIVTGVSSSVRLQVRSGDLERAAAILDDHPIEQPRDDGEGAGVVRCPRCELAYCFHERIHLEGSSAATALAFFAAPFIFLVKKRWRCHKCGHAWDDPKEGPAEMTRLASDDPTPVFRLRRAHGGMGLFLGIMVGFLGSLVVAGLSADVRGPALVACFFVPVLGWILGRSRTYDLCSEPGCRTPILPDREDCPRCKGVLGGIIRTAEEHYACAADVRRELAALRSADRAPRKKGRS
ncbi:MAG: hypothetical protein QM820_14030 [Minicystis sp.]